MNPPCINSIAHFKKKNVKSLSIMEENIEDLDVFSILKQDVDKFLFIFCQEQKFFDSCEFQMI